MKKYLPIILVLFIFIIGAGICSYPIIATYVNQKNESRVVENMQKAVSEIDSETIEREKVAVKQYNDYLESTHKLLTDPFDFIISEEINEEYQSLLNYSESMAAIEIPIINLNLPIYHGTDEEILSKGVGHLPNTSLPLGGSGTHAVFSAHTGLPTKKLFTDLDKLNEGDIFYIYVLEEKLSYQVDQIKVIDPDDSNDLLIMEGKDYVTLLTCTPYGVNTHRLLVRGIRIPNEVAEETENLINKELSLIDKLLMNFGISLRELIVYSSIIVLGFIFILIFIIGMTSNRKKRLS